MILKTNVVGTLKTYKGKKFSATKKGIKFDVETDERRKEKEVIKLNKYLSFCFDPDGYGYLKLQIAFLEWVKCNLPHVA